MELPFSLWHSERRPEAPLLTRIRAGTHSRRRAIHAIGLIEELSLLQFIAYLLLFVAMCAVGFYLGINFKD